MMGMKYSFDASPELARSSSATFQRSAFNCSISSKWSAVILPFWFNFHVIRYWCSTATSSVCIPQSTSLRRQARQQYTQRHHFRLGIKIVSLIAWVEHYLARCPNVFAADIKALVRRRIANGTFDLDGPAIFRVELNNEIYFCARRTAIEGRSSGGWQRSEDVLDEHSLPACTHHRMPHESFHVADVEERMEQSAIADIDFWCADKALLRIRSPWLKATDEQKIHHDVEIAGDGMAADAENACEVCGIQHLALVVSQHLPVAAQSLRWDTRAKHRHIALKIGQ